jgi:putative Mg2+ transporter-C (MgtC) family protein
VFHWGDAYGQGWLQLAELGLALLLSAAIGTERQLRRKPAGIRTHTVVGLGAALFLLVSKYGFDDVLEPGRVVVDPSRVAAQIVSGLGFLGAGLIFVRRDAVRGLTTAATIWLVAAIATAAAAGMPLVAIACTAAYFVVLYVITPAGRYLARGRHDDVDLICSYVDGRGILRDVVAVCTTQGWSLTHLDTIRADPRIPIAEPENGAEDRRIVQVELGLSGRGATAGLVIALSELSGVVGIREADRDD